MIRKNYNGYVLLIVLIFIQTFSLMSLYELFSTKLLLKAEFDSRQRAIIVNFARNILYDIEQEISIFTDCFIPLMLTSAIAKKPMSWWQVNACSGNVDKFHYYYVIEFLGEDPCGIIKNGVIDDQGNIASYYRVTLLTMLTNMKYKKILLQSTVADTTNNVSSCSKPHRVFAGRQMLHEIDSI